MRPKVWNIRVLIETDDEAVVDAKVEAIEEVLCASSNLRDPKHRCDPPWFIITAS